MRIGGVGGTITPATTRRGASEAREEQAPETEGRALIAIEAPAASERTPRPTRHPSASFVAQLIATHMQAPQTRARRRAEPAEAIAVYRSMTKPVSRRRSFATRV
jgi:K+-sensing histidine kinase KdpD